MPGFLSLWSIRNILYSLIFCVMFPSLGIFIYYARYDYIQYFEKCREHCYRVASAIAEQQRDLVEESRHKLGTLALIHFTEIVNHGGAEQIFRSFMANDQKYKMVALSDNKGHIVSSYPQFSHDIDISDRKHFREAIATKQFAVGEYVIARGVEGPCLPFAYPILNANNEVEGVLTAIISLDIYDRSISLSTLPEQSRLVILDHNGIRLYRYPQKPEFPIGTLATPTLITAINSAPDESSFKEAFDSLGTHISYAIERLRLSPDAAPYMAVVVGTPTPKTVELFRERLWKPVILFSIITALSIISAHLLGLIFIRKGFNRLISATKQLASGDLSARAENGVSCLEVIELSHAFNQMADSLSQESADRKLTEKNLRESEERKRLILDTANEGVMTIDAEKHVTYVNKTMANMFGYSEEEMLTLQFSDFIFPEDFPLHEQETERRRRGLSCRIERRFKRKNGSAVWTIFAANSLFDNTGVYAGAFGMFTDITERKLAEEALQDSQERFRALIAQASDSIFVTDFKGRPHIVNKRACESLGYAEEELLRMTVADWDPDFKKRNDEQTFWESLPVTFEARHKRKDGSIFHVEVSLSKIEFNDRNMILANVRDITERKQNEELRNQIERVIQHDLRSPACNAIAIAEMFNDAKNLSDEQRHLLDLFNQAGKNMLDTLNSSLDLFKIESGEYKLSAKKFDTIVLIKSVLKGLAIPMSKKRINSEIRLNGAALSQHSHCFCMGDPKILRTAFQNLVLNALEASPPSQVISVNLVEGGQLTIEIINKGAVPVEIRDKFFEKYVTKGKTKGTGLGTYSAMKTIKAHGGDITMHTSDEDNETTVTVMLPC